MSGSFTLVYRNPEGDVRSRLVDEITAITMLKGRPIYECDTAHMDAIFKLEKSYYFNPSAKFQDGMMAPHAFGIIVVDFRDNVFMSANITTRLDRFSVTDAVNWSGIDSVFKKFSKAFYETGDNRLRVRTRTFTIFQQKTVVEETFGDPLSMEEAIAMLPEMFEDAKATCEERVVDINVKHVMTERDFMIDYSPMDTKNLAADDDHSSLIMVLARMKELGFEFTQADIQAWDEKIVKALERKY